MPDKPIRKLNRPVEERFWEYVDIGSVNECWPWLGGKDRKGYGRFQIATGKPIRAHRFAFQLEYGPVPRNYQSHHTCENKACCNPHHLKAMPPGEHTLIGNGFSGANARKTHCKRGHELTPENCYDYAGKRDCKQCARLRARKEHL